MFNILVNKYGHIETYSQLTYSHFSWASLY